MINIAEFWVTNSLNDNKSVKFNLTLRYFVIKGEKGEHMWTLEIGTTHLDLNGDPISPKRVHNISADDLDDVIESAVVDLCAQIDWSPLSIDRRAPYVDSYSPSGNNTPIGSKVYITIKDNLLSAGIDLSEMKVILNNGMVDFDITSELEITGDPYEYQLKWDTPLRVYDTYE